MMGVVSSESSKYPYPSAQINRDYDFAIFKEDMQGFYLFIHNRFNISISGFQIVKLWSICNLGFLLDFCDRDLPNCTLSPVVPRIGAIVAWFRCFWRRYRHSILFSLPHFDTFNIKHLISFYFLNLNLFLKKDPIVCFNSAIYSSKKFLLSFQVYRHNFPFFKSSDQWIPYSRS